MSVKLKFVLVVVLLIASVTGSHAIAKIGDMQTFSDGGTPIISDGLNCLDCLVNGWTSGVGGVELDAGEDGIGDHAALYDSGGWGFHFLTWEGYGTVADTNFLGNYLDAGVIGIRFRARHSGVGDSLTLRAFLFNFNDSQWPTSGALSNTAVVIANTDTTWQTHTISLDPSNMETRDLLGGVPPTISEILEGVGQAGLRHDPGFTGPGWPAFTSSRVYFDDIQLIIIPDDSFVDPSVVIGYGSTVKKGVEIYENVELGDDVSVNKNTSVGANTTIDDNTTLNKGVDIGSGVVIGENVIIGKNVIIEDGVTIGDNTTIGKGVYICSNATIGNDVMIGRNQLVDTSEIVTDFEILPGVATSVPPDPCTPPAP